MPGQDISPTTSPYASPVATRSPDRTAPASNNDRPHLDLLSKGFDLAALASVAIQAINAFYVGGLILDLMAASLSFLTARWLQRLSEEEKDRFETALGQKNRQAKKQMSSRSSSSDKQGNPEEGRMNAQPVLPLHERILYAWMSFSLFSPLPLLIIGVVCMFVGIYVYVWTQQPKAVAIVVTAAGGAALPFVAGVFAIGQKEERRAVILSHLVSMQGDW
ncbi:hypothetical protein GALMADRAFT_215871 [Galerina marginata CBS 339.88]|uniref:Uncharacterized protein n=1 Tax=Galerina marginata (strain CBS 339.88) TaxID=685588 RepID=A0A067SC21_GALM3|nr:hypothetical protein GALMADRAFT_215871 [Galerina marginata CBS 339.88]